MGNFVLTPTMANRTRLYVLSGVRGLMRAVLGDPTVITDDLVQCLRSGARQRELDPGVLDAAADALETLHKRNAELSEMLVQLLPYAAADRLRHKTLE